MNKRLRILLVCILTGFLLFQTLPNDSIATTSPTGTGLALFAEMALREGWGYVYGTYGQTMTRSLIDSKANQYPSAFAEVKSDGQTVYKHALKWVGSRAADCIGLAKAYLWWQGDKTGPRYQSATDYSANSAYYSATRKGPISTMPQAHGVMVWRDNHVGIYVGNDEVIEARGVEYGVVKTRLSDRSWTAWFYLPRTSYVSTGWVTFLDEQYYYKNGQYVTGIQQIDGKTYFFADNGARQSGFHFVDGQLRYFAPDGQTLLGWQRIAGNAYYFRQAAVAATGRLEIDGRPHFFSDYGNSLSGWQEIDEKICFLDERGQPLQGDVEQDSRTIGLAADGQPLQGWQETPQGFVYYRQDGSRAPAGLLHTAEGIYFLGQQGNRLSGWQETAAGRAWFDPQNGQRVAAGLQEIMDQDIRSRRLFTADGTLADAGKPVYTAGSWFICATAGQPSTASLSVTGTAAGGAAFSLQLQSRPDDQTLAMSNQTDYACAADLPSLRLPLQGGQATMQLSVTGRQPDGATWFSLDPAVATVDETGLLTAVGPGRTLAGLAADGRYALVDTLVIPAQIIGPSTLERRVGDCGPAPFEGFSATWSDACRLTSEDADVVAVLANGSLLAQQPGETTINLTFQDEVLYSMAITVQKPLIGLTAPLTTLNLAVGERYQCPVAPLPADAVFHPVYSSSQPQIAAVDPDGTIRALAVGEASITVQQDDLTHVLTVSVSGSLTAMRRGSDGEAVARLATRLSDLNYLPGDPSDTFDPLMEYAVRSIQMRLQQDITGVADVGLQRLLYDERVPPATPLRQTGLLQKGDQGEQVHILQQRLADLNYYKIKPDGQFGEHTAQALRVMQSINQLAVTGKAAPVDLDDLFKEGVKAGRPTLRRGDSGPEVVLLQQRLAQLNDYHGPVNGSFDAVVEKAVRQFQQRNKLAVDGLAGPMTQSRLFAGIPAVQPQPEPTPVPTPPATSTPSPTPTPAPSDPPAGGEVPQAPVLSGTLRRGSRGDAVRLVQQRLSQLGYAVGVIDGIFGSQTDQAVRSYQRQNNLTVDGIIGRQTISHLFSGAPPATPTPSPTPTPAPQDPPAGGEVPQAPVLSGTLRRGSRGDTVRLVQQRLSQLGYAVGVIDGIFGTQTDQAVRQFQNKAKLTVDGLVGRQTVASLYSTTAPEA